MPFIIHALDYPDAPDRRKATRDAHLAALTGLKAEKKVLYAAAILNDTGDMIGSMLVMDLTRGEIDSWLKDEPYVLNKVWEKIDVLPCRPAPL